MESITPTLLEYEQEIIRQIGQPVFHKKGSIIFRLGDAADRVFMIERGLVKIFRLTTDGRHIAVGSIRHPGELMGLAEALQGGERSCYAGAINDVELVVVRRDDFQEMLLCEPHLAIKIARMLATRMREAESSIHELVSRSVPGRLAAMLIKLGRRYGEQMDGGGTRINLNLTHEELASMIGSSRQTVTSLMAMFRDENSISVKGKEISITDPQKLANWIV